MAKLEIRKSLFAERDSVVPFKEIESLINGLGKIGKIRVTAPDYSSNFSHNMHGIFFYYDGKGYTIRVTENQFKKLLPLLKERGEVDIEKSWIYR